MMEDVGLDDIELVQISTKDLNRHLKKKAIDNKRQKEVKARRRTLKNRFLILILTRALGWPKFNSNVSLNYLVL